MTSGPLPGQPPPDQPPPDPAATDPAATDRVVPLARDSFIELHARARATALLDDGTARELCGPFDRIESPWLAAQEVVPQSDDGVVVVKGELGRRPVVVVAIEQAFQGGGIGEVSGAKITAALSLAAQDNRHGVPTAAILLLETGGVRLQEANLGLATVAEVCSAVLELRALSPVIGVIAGALGCFGGMSIAAALCTELIMTREGRLGLNGPEVIESEAGVAEFDASDHTLIWSIHGGTQRTATGLANVLVSDDVAEVRSAVREALGRGVPDEHRSQRIGELRALLEAVDPAHPPDPADLPALRVNAAPVGSAVRTNAAPGEPAVPANTAPGESAVPANAAPGESAVPANAAPGEGGRPMRTRDAAPASRGLAWIRALAGGEVGSVVPSVVTADMSLGNDSARLLAVVPDPGSPYHRARAGEVGLREGPALAEAVTEVVTTDAGLPEERRRPIVAVVDVPSQAYGRVEELLGIHHALATAVDAYASARTAGHPVIALIVGTALSGGFLAHGSQAGRMLALDDPKVVIHAMHEQAAARVTRRTVAELEELAQRIPPLSYDVADWAKLGLCDELLDVGDADEPTGEDVGRVRAALTAVVGRARHGPRDLSDRLTSPAALRTRAASRRIHEALTAQWR
ncbi:biotin-independent malonate decarboxylase subunit beta [Sphaerisporangium rhizosphaerae]|uniref:Biotin-independent malonate decarboxylase subunit beta n=1 Tax=Sphaerisporangium rhizosphaerae TaxID=2269375 RepID=A0ABW2NWW1_9ACTN